MKSTKQETLLSLKKAADILDVSERSMYRYIDDGRLKASKIGYWKIKPQDLEEFIKRSSNTRKK